MNEKNVVKSAVKERARQRQKELIFKHVTGQASDEESCELQDSLRGIVVDLAA